MVTVNRQTVLWKFNSNFNAESERALALVPVRTSSKLLLKQRIGGGRHSCVIGILEKDGQDPPYTKQLGEYKISVAT